jgi:ABC-type nickel/cobalt efflux system permease component RcnA
MKYSPALLILCAVGLVLMVAGYMFGSDSGTVARAAWTEDQAKKFTEASASFHQIAHAHGDAQLAHNNGHNHAADAPSEAEYEKAKSDWQEQLRLRDGAIAWRNRVRSILKYTGVALISIGGVGFLVVKNILEDQD